MKNLFLSIGTLLLSMNISMAQNPSPGELNTSFGVNGVAITDLLSNESDRIYGMTLQDDGKIVAVGYAGSNDEDAAVARFNTDGTLDNTFSADGKYISDLGNSDSDELSDVDIQPDGKIVTVGYTHDGNDFDAVLIRLNADGSIDNGFGNSGLVVIDLGNDENEWFRALQVTSDDKIVCVGAAFSGGNYNGLIMRFNTDGSVDTTYGNAGQLVIDASLGGTESFNDVSVLNSGYVIAVGDGDQVGSKDILVCRTQPDGTMDATFGNSGIVWVDVENNSDDRGNGCFVQQNGEMVIVGEADGNDHKSAIVRLKGNGIMDTDFTGDGWETYEFAPGYTERFYDVVEQENGKIVACGNADINGDKYQITMARYHTDGIFDYSFDSDGRLTMGYDTVNDAFCNAMALDADGSIFVGGHTDGDFAIAKVHGDFIQTTTGIFNLEEQVEASVWPNPFTTGVVAEVNADTDEWAMYDLTDVTGRFIAAGLWDAKEKLILDNVFQNQPEGTYILNIRLGSLQTSKVLLKQ